MGIRSRPRKDLAASFQRARQMMVDLKSARKSLAAQHTLLADLVSVALYPSPKESLWPPAVLSGDRSLSECPPLLSPPRQPCEQREACDEAQISTLLPLSPRKAASVPLGSRSLKILALLSSLPAKNAKISAADLRNEDSKSRKFVTSSVHPGRRFSQRVFWVPLLLVFLYFFLCTGKEIAVVVAVSAYMIFWLLRKVCIFLRVFPASSQSIEPVSTREVPLMKETPENSRIIVPMSCQKLASSSSDFQLPCRSQCLPVPEDCPKGGPCLKDSGDLQRPQISFRTTTVQDILLANIKLSVVLIVAPFGLAYGYAAAMCLCSSCILLLLLMQELAKRMGLRNSKPQLSRNI